jgi:hypothetical protein
LFDIVYCTGFKRKVIDSDQGGRVFVVIKILPALSPATPEGVPPKSPGGGLDKGTVLSIYLLKIQ